MIPKAKLETFTPVDKLQLGRSEVNPEDLQNVDKELKELKEQVEMVEQVSIIRCHMTDCLLVNRLALPVDNIT